jgi:hypothetical protein
VSARTDAGIFALGQLAGEAIEQHVFVDKQQLIAQVAALSETVRLALVPEVVTTLEELQKLPAGTVIREATARIPLPSIYERSERGDADDWYETGFIRTTESPEIQLPVLVLYRPEGA